MNYRRQNLAWAGLALAFAAAAPSVRAADEGGDRAASTSGEPADRAVNSWQQAKQAVRAVRDKETGRLRAPTDEELPLGQADIEAAVQDATSGMNKQIGRMEPLMLCRSETKG